MIIGKGVEEFKIIKSLLKLIKSYGFKRDKNAYVLENYLLIISKTELVFQKINENINSGVFLSSVKEISSYDLSFYYNPYLKNEKYIKDIIFYLKYDFEKELKSIVRKNKIKKLYEQ